VSERKAQKKAAPSRLLTQDWLMPILPQMPLQNRAGSSPVQVPLNTHSHTRIEFEPLLDVIDAAKLLRIHPKTLRAKAGRGIIPGIQIGRVWRFRASMLNRWLEGMTDRGRRQKSQ